MRTNIPAGHNGQACFWFSNGCSIGCPECDGTTRGPSIHTNKTDICGKNYKATVCDPALRTVNTGAECGSQEDTYYYSPWRAPGSAPVLDSCGMAGGSPEWGHHGAQYRTSSHASQGDRGSLSLAPGVAGEPSIVDLIVIGTSQEISPGKLETRSMSPGPSLPTTEEATSTDCVPRAATSLRNVSRRCHWTLWASRDLSGRTGQTSGSMEPTSLREPFRQVLSGR